MYLWENARAVRQESALAASARESTSERQVSLLRFCDHGLMKIVRDLTGDLVSLWTRRSCTCTDF